MLEGICGLLLIIVAIIITILCIIGVVESDGKCPFDTCDDCPFPCDPEMRKRLKEKNTESDD